MCRSYIELLEKYCAILTYRIEYIIIMWSNRRYPLAAIKMMGIINSKQLKPLLFVIVKSARRHLDYCHVFYFSSVEYDQHRTIRRTTPIFDSK